MFLVELALAPALIFFIYIFIRDKYEKEPLRLLIVSGIYGALLTIIVLLVQKEIEVYFVQDNNWRELLSSAFIISAGVEEVTKFIFLYFLVWKNKNFNEPFDGIVYSVFISIGFAAFENIIYVLNPQIGGVETAILRGIFSVPGHGLFGIIMGYYFAISKFNGIKNDFIIIKGLFITWLVHGVFNAILLSGSKYYLVVFIPYVIWLWKNGLHKINVYLRNSPFR